MTDEWDLHFLRGMHGAPAEAAAEIERLRAEVEGLREALGEWGAARPVTAKEWNEKCAEVEKLRTELDRFIKAHSAALTAQMKAEAEVERLRNQNVRLVGEKAEVWAEVERLRAEGEVLDAMWRAEVERLEGIIACTVDAGCPHAVEVERLRAAGEKELPDVDYVTSRMAPVDRFRPELDAPSEEKE
jgi:chromosome segregation ATPase